jgi:hypothetical protein
MPSQRSIRTHIHRRRLRPMDLVLRVEFYKDYNEDRLCVSYSAKLLHAPSKYESYSTLPRSTGSRPHCEYEVVG